MHRRPRDRRVQQAAGIIGGQPLDHQLRETFEPLRVARLAHPKYQSNPFGQETTRHEREHPYRHPVKPLRVVDDAHKRPLLGGVGKQAQDSQTDQETIRRGTGAEAKRRAQRQALRARQPPEAAEHRHTQRMQAGECELHLRLDAGRSGDPASVRVCRQMFQQSGLADSCLTAEDKHTTLPRAHSRDESLQHVALEDTVEQPRPWKVGVQHLSRSLSRPRVRSSHDRLTDNRPE